MAEGLDTIGLSAFELQQVTDWDDLVIQEWLNLVRNTVLVSDQGDGNQTQIDQNTTDISTNTRNISTNTTNLNNHTASDSEHGVTGDNVGDADRPTLALGGAVLLAAAVTNAVASTVSVTSADATDLPTVITLANELKADVNTLVTDVNNAITQFNSLLANLRSSGTLDT